MVVEKIKMTKKQGRGWNRSLGLLGCLAIFFLVGCKQKEERQIEVGSIDEVSVAFEGITKNEVETAVKNFNEAMVNPTAEVMEKLCSKDLSYGHSSGLIQDRAQFVDDIINGPFNFSSVESPEQTIYISGNTAIVRHIFLAKATNAGAPLDIRIGNVQVYQKGKNGSLELLARQAYKLPN